MNAAKSRNDAEGADSGVVGSYQHILAAAPPCVAHCDHVQGRLARPMTWYCTGSASTLGRHVK